MQAAVRVVRGGRLLIRDALARERVLAASAQAATQSEATRACQPTSTATPKFMSVVWSPAPSVPFTLARMNEGPAKKPRRPPYPA